MRASLEVGGHGAYCGAAPLFLSSAGVAALADLCADLCGDLWPDLSAVCFLNEDVASVTCVQTPPGFFRPRKRATAAAAMAANIPISHFNDAPFVEAMLVPPHGGDTLL